MERNPDVGLLHNEQRCHVTRSARPPCRVNEASKRGATWLSRGLSFAAREPHESVVAGLQVWLVAAIPTAPTRKARWWSSRFSIQPIAHSQRADKKAEILLFFLPLTSQKSVSSIPPPREHVGLWSQDQRHIETGSTDASLGSTAIENSQFNPRALASAPEMAKLGPSLAGVWPDLLEQAVGVASRQAVSPATPGRSPSVNVR